MHLFGAICLRTVYALMPVSKSQRTCLVEDKHVHELLFSVKSTRKFILFPSILDVRTGHGQKLPIHVKTARKRKIGLESAWLISFQILLHSVFGANAISNVPQRRSTNVKPMPSRNATTWNGGWRSSLNYPRLLRFCLPEVLEPGGSFWRKTYHFYGSAGISTGQALVKVPSGHNVRDPGGLFW